MAKFAHYRLVSGADADGQPMWKSRGGVTICYADVEGGTIDWAASVCAPEDNFCKAAGRVKAQGRLLMKSMPERYKFMRGSFKPGGASKEDTEKSVGVTLDGIAHQVFFKMMEKRIEMLGMAGLAIPSFEMARKFGQPDFDTSPKVEIEVAP